MILFLVLAYLLYKKSKNKYQIILPNKAKRLIKKNYFKKIIDVRSIDEYSKGHYPDSINIPYNKIVKKYNNKEPLLIYCRSGRRAKIAAQYFNNVYLIEGNYKSLLDKNSI